MARPSITVQIILPEDTSKTKSTSPSPVRHSGEDVWGHLEVITCGTFGFCIDVSFEGHIRTWINPGNGGEHEIPHTAELQFLKQTQQVLSDPLLGSNRSNQCLYRLPFRFSIPYEAISARADVHSSFLQLSPSAKVGMMFRKHSQGQIYRQPEITYVVKITSVRTEIPTGNTVRPNLEREVTVIPYGPPAPPLVMDDFPQDYRSSAMSFLKQHRWKRPCGVLKVSAAEPSPLNIWTSTPRSSSLAILKLVFTPVYPCEFESWSRKWKYTVEYYLRSRTFSSIQTLDQVPTVTTAKLNPYLKVCDENGASEVREYGPLSWNRDCQPGSSEQSASADAEGASAWTSTLMVTVNAAKTLLPTFLNQLSARQYAIILRLSIEGVHHRLVELVLPLQVFNCPPQNASFGTDEETRAETLDGISPLVTRFSHQFTADDVSGQHRSLQDVSPPIYNI